MNLLTLRGLGLASTLAVAALLAVAAAPAAASDLVYNANPGGSDIQITGDADTDLLTIASTATTVTIDDAGAGGITTAAPCSVVGTTVTCPVSPGGGNGPLVLISADLLAGADSLTSSSPIRLAVTAGPDPDSLTGGPGDDNLGGEGAADTVNGGGGEDFLGGNGGNDSVSGGDDRDILDGGPGDDVVSGDAGNDDVVGEGGSDSLNGGDGDDFLADGGPADPLDPAITGTDVLSGGPGQDFADYGDRDVNLTLSLDNVANDGEPGEGDNLVDIESVAGGTGDDVLTGNDVANLLTGDEGDDSISGLGGRDLVSGEDGDDSVSGGADADEVDCGAGTDAAVVDPLDQVDLLCERIGAVLGGNDTVSLNAKGQGRVSISCAVGEGVPCVGTLALSVGGKEIGKGTYNVPAGATSKVKVKLDKPGLKKLTKAGNTLFATVEATTTEPAGDSVSAEKVLLQGKAKSGGKGGKGHGGKGGNGPKA